MERHQDELLSDFGILFVLFEDEEFYRRCDIATTTMEQVKQAQIGDRSEAARAYAIEAARLAANTRCHQVRVLDVRGLCPVADFFVIASGTSARQMRTVVEEIQELGDARGYSPMARSGYEGESWMLLDCVDVLVHVFNDTARHYYDLDGLWGDAKQVQWQEQTAAAAR
jgi:ribosome-associated protein